MFERNIKYNWWIYNPISLEDLTYAIVCLKYLCVTWVKQSISLLNLTNFVMISNVQRSCIASGHMMTSSNGNIFRITGPLCGHRWIPLTKASDAKLWWFLWSAPEQTSLLSKRRAGDFRCHRAHYDIIILSVSNADWKGIWSSLFSY